LEREKISDERILERGVRLWEKVRERLGVLYRKLECEEMRKIRRMKKKRNGW